MHKLSIKLFFLLKIKREFQDTVWKFKNLSTIHILREINFSELNSSVLLISDNFYLILQNQNLKSLKLSTFAFNDFMKNFNGRKMIKFPHYAIEVSKASGSLLLCTTTPMLFNHFYFLSFFSLNEHVF